MLTLGMIAAVIYLFTSTRKGRAVALSKGAEEDELTYFAVFLWLYIVPPIVSMLFALDFNILILLVMAAFYIPGIVASKKLAGKLNRGYDFERKAGREYDKAMWLGMAGIGLVMLNGLFAGARSLLSNR